MNTVVTASVPGKVLICGGYTILERPNRGIVLSTTSRFRTTVSFADQNLKMSGNTSIFVESVQYGATYEYTMRMSEGPVELVCINDCAPNKYVKLALATALSAAETLFPGSVGILKEKALYVQLLADNDFYSHAKQLTEMGLELTVESLRSIPAGAPATSQSGELSKTGLGSSAALITSLVAAILHFFGKPHIEQTHRVAQVAHAVVQGKIGSGFDVYAACYGSSVYTRYSREAIEAAESPLASIESSLWDHKGDKIMLPCKMQLVCGDVAGGSETPSMSRKILAWKSAAIAVDGNVPDLWQRLLEANNMAIGNEDIVQLVCC